MGVIYDASPAAAPPACYDARTWKMRIEFLVFLRCLAAALCGCSSERAKPAPLDDSCSAVTEQRRRIWNKKEEVIG
jgi:hypothetical protein